MLGLINNLRNAGVLGINARNNRYIMPYNTRALYPRVDDKVLTKQLAQEAGIHVPELYGVISTIRESTRIHDIIGDRRQFVIKPAHGSGGKGIFVITDRRKHMFFKPDGSGATAVEMGHHVTNILSGVYSLGGQVDQAIIEYCVNFDPVFNTLSYQGVPDIRVIVFRGLPIMAMLRLPTKESNGKANLHQGAVGVGIDMLTGITRDGTYRDKRIYEHPEFGTALSGREIPGWENLILLAARCHALAPLGYLGVDMVLDATLGPLVLELNARPGLAIQIANGLGLIPRLELFSSISRIPDTAEDRVALSLSLIKQLDPGRKNHNDAA